MKLLRNSSLFIIILIFFLELSSLIFLKLKIFKNFEHSNLTFDFTEIDTNNLMNLKKNIAINTKINIFTDENKLRVKENGFQTNLDNENLSYGNSNFSQSGIIIASNNKNTHKNMCLQIKEIIIQNNLYPLNF